MIILFIYLSIYVDRFYRGAIGALLVYDITNPSTFENLESWLDELQVQDEDTVIMLLGNKCDLSDKREVPANKAELFAGKLYYCLRMHIWAQLFKINDAVS